MNEHPTLGTISSTTREGLAGNGARLRVVWAACESCGRERWTPLRKPARICASCAGRKIQPKGAASLKPANKEIMTGKGNPAWRGGTRRTAGKYIAVWVRTDDPFYAMTGKDGRYILEHRLVMARSLGRCLEAYETVHHRNGNPIDNRLENLELWVGNHGSGHRVHEHHCPGCRCFEVQNERTSSEVC